MFILHIIESEHPTPHFKLRCQEIIATNEGLKSFVCKQENINDSHIMNGKKSTEASCMGKLCQKLKNMLGRDRSTIWREFKRNSGKTGYRAFSASKRAQARAGTRRKGKRKLTKYRELGLYVGDKLSQKWSPRERSQRLKIEYARDMSMRISHEAIYQYIYVLPRCELKRTLIEALRQEHKYCYERTKGKNTEETRGKIANMLFIEELPAEVADRSVPGHWEGDLILGKYKRSARGTLVERAQPGIQFWFH